MRRTRALPLATAALVLGGWARAHAADTTLYVRVKNTRLLDKPAATAKVVTTLQPPQAVTWKGAAKEDKRWHEVEVQRNGNPLKGYVFQPNLSTQQPSMELEVSKGSRLDAKAFANSGAAIKAASSEEITGGRQVTLQQAAEQLEELSQLAHSVTDEQVVAHALKAGLPPMAEPASKARGGKKP